MTCYVIPQFITEVNIIEVKKGFSKKVKSKGFNKQRIRKNVRGRGNKLCRVSELNGRASF